MSRDSAWATRGPPNDSRSSHKSTRGTFGNKDKPLYRPPRGSTAAPRSDMDNLEELFSAVNISPDQRQPSNAFGFRSTPAPMKMSTEGLRKSRKDWGAEHEQKRVLKVQDMPLVSKGGWNQEDKGLHRPEAQRELYQHIQKQIRHLQTAHGTSAPLDPVPPTDPATLALYKTRKVDLDYIVELYRKLREGVVASKLSEGDVYFSRRAFEDSVDGCLVARNFGELLKSLVGLSEIVYPALREPSQTTPLYTSYHILYEACYATSYHAALSLLYPRTPAPFADSPHLSFARRVLYALIHASHTAFFRLRREAPTPGHVVLMDTCAVAVRERAIRCWARAYLRVEIVWAASEVGIEEKEGDSVVEIVKAVMGEAVDRVEGGVMWFRRGQARKPAPVVSAWDG